MAMGLVFAPLVILVILSTIYVYSHYVVDSLAGLAVGIMLYLFVPPLIEILMPLLSGGATCSVSREPAPVSTALVDTHALLWMVSSSERLSSSARDVIVDESNELYFSIAGY